MSRTTAIILLSALTIAGLAFSKFPFSSSGKDITFTEESLSSRLKITNKLRSNLTLTLRPSSDAEFEVGQDFTLTAELASDVNLKNVALSWALPPDVILVSGEMTAVVPEVHAGEVKLIEIVVRGSSMENSRIFLRASLAENGVKFNETAQYNTVLQKQIEKDKAALADRTRDAVESQDSKFKIFK